MSRAPNTEQEDTLFVPPRDVSPDGRDISLARLVNVLIRDSGRIAAIAVIIAVLGVLPVMFAAPRYTATASLILQGNDQSRSGLAGLAGQLGVAGPGVGSPTQSPGFYADLLKSRSILDPIVRSKIPEPDGRGDSIALVDLFKIGGPDEAVREEAARLTLSNNVLTATVSKATGVVTVTASSPWPSVSLQILQRTLQGMNGFSVRLRQEQAAADRKYGEERLAITRDSLRAAEDRLQEFLQSNRLFQTSPDLAVRHERLQREVSLQQQVFVAATEAYEDAKAREMRDTPVLTLVDSASVGALPDPRGRLRRGLLGLIFGVVIGCLISLGGEVIAARRRSGDPDLGELELRIGALRETTSRWLGRRRRSGR